MRIQKTDNNNIPSFKTYLGLELQEKILLAKSRGIFSHEHTNNLTKIENNNSDTVLDVSKKFIIKRFANKKNSLEIKRVLSLKNQTDTFEIADLSHIYTPTSSKKQVSFSIHRFLKIFSDQFDLPSKVEKILNP